MFVNFFKKLFCFEKKKSYFLFLLKKKRNTWESLGEHIEQSVETYTGLAIGKGITVESELHENR